MTIEQLSTPQSLNGVATERLPATNAVDVSNAVSPSVPVTERTSGVQRETESPQVDRTLADNETRSATETENVQQANQQLTRTAERLQDAIEVANSFASVNEQRLEFSLSGDSNRSVVRVLNKENDELIRQIPSEEFLRISERIQSLNEEYENVRGLLFNETV